MVRLVEESGTQWPVPVSWKETSEGIFEGAEGLLKLSLEDGDLIDPARCRVGEALRPAGWELVRTVNGTAITGTYEETGARVVVFSEPVNESPRPGSVSRSRPVCGFDLASGAKTGLRFRHAVHRAIHRRTL